ncbi:MAG: isoprenylcysteine carboxylmethyltransferase family protein [Clostridia bacterium]|nr:isoprenylcysteine carboxylmethyltransferase family protein [Clostridia bacterium]
MKLLINGLIKFVCGLLLVALLVFLPAGTIEYFGGLLFVGVLFVPILILGAVLFFKAPDLLAKRLDSKEKQGAQKAVVALSALGFIAGFVVAGLDFRFGWSSLPVWVSVVASVLFLISYGLYAEVMRENAYLSRTVKVEEGQQVVSTGLYGIVRHPMYAATVLMFMMIPLILGSLPSFVIFLHYPVLISVRIKNEEKLLVRELAGYEEYRNKVKYRLIPFVW